ncbi:hypothetical protein ETD86_54690 [Nonomuraea turkmeniaca]|uniref:Uncharacterized protein n=1 Tax=Nonomuraea turkmeniaca TaxID=103838 RepID=A0A5S4ETV5_9ACTN|nr:hypothetical protein ETD86_54690 [Nonomuraea turkmeniaca]
MTAPTTDWITWLQADTWVNPFAANATATKISDKHPSEAREALNYMTWNARRIAREFASQTIHTPAPDGVGDWWPRTPKERSRVRKDYSEWIKTTPLAVALEKRTTFKGDASRSYEVRGADGLLKPMTWGDLRSIAMRQPADALVILASDAEENSFHPLMTVTLFAHYVESKYAIDSTVHGSPQQGSKPCILLTPAD